ncbi:MAG TPA: DUF5700 domain-containing putative Zn-dependent protease, partial [Gemmatimonadales bacterium]|nr:DUF5700 domain-containing putative Zn-dependent protease [Gemmatimonadales bacterium]
LDTDQSGAVFANTVAHELHHIGLGAACDRAGEARYADTSAAAAKARNWLGAFGEGLAMLAAAGGPNVHPHRDSPPSERERWDRDSRDAAAQMVALERFFLSILNGRLTADSAITRQGMEFFGVQGPWYTVGYRMWSTVERRLGRARVVADACEPARLIVDYDLAVAQDRSAPRWSPSFVRAMRALQAPRL